MHLPTRLISPATSLHTKLMLTLATLLTFVVACVTYVLLEHERQNRFMELETRADSMANLASRSMAYSVWNVDLEAIDELLSSLSSDLEVAQLTITAVGYGKLREISKQLGPLVNPIIRIQDINFETAETGSQKIGEVRVVLTRALVEQGITKAHRTVWVIVVVTLVLLYTVTFLLFNRMVSAPINRLETTVDRISIGDLDARCTVDSGDELGRLAMRVNTMADRLCDADWNLRDSETRLQLVVEGSQLGSWDWNIETGEVIRNARWAEMLGYTPEEVGNSVKQSSDLYHPDDRNLALTSINDHLEGKTSAHDIEYRMRTKDGQYKWILDQAKVVKWDEKGKPLRMCGTHKDITDRKLAEQEHKQLQKQLSQAQKMQSIGTLAGGIAHDFNNILTSILGFGQLMKTEIDPDSPLLDDLQEIMIAGNRAKDLVKQILTFARQSDEKLSIIRVDLILKEVIQLMRSSIPTSIKIESTIESKSAIFGNATQIHQIFMNLFTNAAFAMDEKGGLLKIAMKDVDRKDKKETISNKFIEVRIIDNGVGIPKEHLESIFDPFFTTKKQDEGTGMGLSVVHGIIEKYGGQIDVKSEFGLGTTFTIYLPVSDRKITKKETDNKDVPKGTERILVVDDEPSIVKMLDQILSKLGYNVSTMTDSIQALNIFQTKPDDFDLVITDMTMPDLTGDVLACEINKLRPNIPILLCSGYSKKITDELLKEIGIVKLIKKPFDKNRLAEDIRMVLDKEVEL